jgi:cold shock CspA family protein/ribosome-associated translation inhibitor RaiA
MELPIQITYRNLAPSDELEALIRERVAKLDRYHDRLTACRVLVEVPHRHRQEGTHFHVRIDLTAPGGEIVVSHEPSLHRSLQDIETEQVAKAADVEPMRQYALVAVREAFDIARRRLQDYARRQRGAVKTHEAPAHGTVIRIGPEEGWIQAADGHEVYFHGNAVLDNAFDRLEVGSEVVLVEEAGEKGPQASTVRLLQRRHHEIVPV